MATKFKKLFYVFAVLLLAIVLVGCKKEKMPTKLTLEVKDFYSDQFPEGETITLERGSGWASLAPVVEPEGASKEVVYSYEGDEGVIRYENGKVYGLKSGVANLVATSKKDPKVSYKIPIYVVENLDFETRVQQVYNHIKANLPKDITGEKVEFPNSIYGDIKVTYTPNFGFANPFVTEGKKIFFKNSFETMQNFVVNFLIEAVVPNGKKSNGSVNVSITKADVQPEDSEIFIGQEAEKVVRAYAQSIFKHPVESDQELSRSLRRMHFYTTGEHHLPKVLEDYLAKHNLADIYVNQWSFDDLVDGKGVKLSKPANEAKEVSALEKDIASLQSLKKAVLQLKAQLEATEDAVQIEELKNQIAAKEAQITELETKLGSVLTIDDLENKYYSKPMSLAYTKPNDYTFGNVSALLRVGSFFYKSSTEVVVRGYTKDEIINVISEQILPAIPSDKNVTENLQLPTYNNQFAIKINWKSSDEDVLKATGRMSLDPVQNNKTATLTASFEYAGTYYDRFAFPTVEFKYIDLKVVQPVSDLAKAGLLLQNAVEDVKNYDYFMRMADRYEKTVVAPVRWKLYDAQIANNAAKIEEAQKELNKLETTLNSYKEKALVAKENASFLLNKEEDKKFPHYFPYGLEKTFDKPLGLVENYAVFDEFFDTTKSEYAPFAGITIDWSCDEKVIRNDLEDEDDHTPSPIFDSSWKITKQFARYRKTKLTLTLKRGGEEVQSHVFINTGLSRDPHDYYQGGTRYKDRAITAGQPFDNIHMVSPYDEVVGQIMAGRESWRRYGLTGKQYTVSFMENGMLKTMGVHLSGRTMVHIALRDLPEEQKLRVVVIDGDIHTKRNIFVGSTLRMTGAAVTKSLLGYSGKINYTSLMNVLTAEQKAEHEPKIKEAWEHKFDAFPDAFKKAQKEKVMANPEPWFVVEYLKDKGIFEQVPTTELVRVANEDQALEKNCPVYQTIEEEGKDVIDWVNKTIAPTGTVKNIYGYVLTKKIDKGDELNHYAYSVNMQENPKYSDELYEKIVKLINEKSNLEIYTKVVSETINGSEKQVNTIFYKDPLGQEIRYMNEDEFIFKNLSSSVDAGILYNINNSDPRFRVANEYQVSGYDQQWVENLTADKELMWGMRYVIDPKNKEGKSIIQKLPDMMGLIGAREWGAAAMTMFPGGYLVDGSGRVFFASDEGDNKAENIVQQETEKLGYKKLDADGNIISWELPNYAAIPAGGFGFSPWTACRGTGTLDFIYKQLSYGHVFAHTYRLEEGKPFANSDAKIGSVLVPKFDFTKSYAENGGVYGTEGDTFSVEFYKAKLQEAEAITAEADKAKALENLKFYYEYHQAKELSVHLEVENYKVQNFEIENVGDTLKTTYKQKEDGTNNTKINLQFYAKPYGSMFTPTASNETEITIQSDTADSYKLTKSNPGTVLELLKPATLKIKVTDKYNKSLVYKFRIIDPATNKPKYVDELTVEVVGTLPNGIEIKGKHGGNDLLLSDEGVNDIVYTDGLAIDIEPKLLPAEAVQSFVYKIYKHVGGKYIEATETDAVVEGSVFKPLHPGKFKVVVMARQNTEIAQELLFDIATPALIGMEISDLPGLAVGQERPLVLKANPGFAIPELNGTFEVDPEEFLLLPGNVIRPLKAGSYTVKYNYQLGGAPQQATKTFTVRDKDINGFHEGITIYKNNTLDLLPFIGIPSLTDLIFEISEPTILSVNTSAVATGLLPGVVTVTVKLASNPSVQKVLTITVLDEPINPTSVQITTPDPLTVVPGQSSTHQLAASVSPAGASQEVIWRSVNPEIAEINNSGEITLKSQGTVTVYAFSAVNGAVFAKKTFNVVIQPATVTELNEAFEAFKQAFIEHGEAKIPDLPYLTVKVNPASTDLLEIVGGTLKIKATPMFQTKAKVDFVTSNPVWEKQAELLVGKLAKEGTEDFHYISQSHKTKNYVTDGTFDIQLGKYNFSGTILKYQNKYYPLAKGTTIKITDEMVSGDTVMTKEQLRPYGDAFNGSLGIMLEGFAGTGNPISFGYYGSGAFYFNDASREVTIPVGTPDRAVIYGRHNLGTGWGHDFIHLQYVDGKYKIKNIYNPIEIQDIKLQPQECLFAPHTTDISRGLCTRVTAGPTGHTDDTDIFGAPSAPDTTREYEFIVSEKPFEQEGGDERTYVKFMLEGGALGSVTEDVYKIVTVGGQVASIGNPTLSGYTFKHWAKEGESTPFNFNTNITEPTVLKAVYGIPQVTVTFDLQGGEGTFDPVTVNKGEVVTKPVATPTKLGHTFKHWSTEVNGAEYDFATPVNESMTLYAVWEVNKLNVTFDLQDGVGTFELNVQVNYGTAVAKPTPDPTKVGHTFKHWSTEVNGAEYDFATPVNASMTLYAVWEPERITVTFDLQGGEGTFELSVQVNYGTAVAKPTPDPTKAGQTFKHWSTSVGGEAYNFDTPVTGPLTLYAVWE